MSEAPKLHLEFEFVWRPPDSTERISEALLTLEIHAQLGEILIKDCVGTIWAVRDRFLTYSCVVDKMVPFEGLREAKEWLIASTAGA